MRSDFEAQQSSAMVDHYFVGEMSVVSPVRSVTGYLVGGVGHGLDRSRLTDLPDCRQSELV